MAFALGQEGKHGGEGVGGVEKQNQVIPENKWMDEGSAANNLL